MSELIQGIVYSSPFFCLSPLPFMADSNTLSYFLILFLSAFFIGYGANAKKKIT